MDSESPLNWDKIMEPTTNMVPIDNNNLLDSEVEISFNYTIVLTIIIILLSFFFCLLLYNNHNINTKLIYKNSSLTENEDCDRKLWN